MSSSTPTPKAVVSPSSASNKSDEEGTAHSTTPPQAMSVSIEDQRAKAHFVYKEEMAPGLRLEMDLRTLLVSTESTYQKIDVVETKPFGKTLVTDGKTQSAQFDEFAYHESLVHPAMLKFASTTNGNNNGPKRVFVGGGGELATAREVLKHKSVEKVIMVDLDEEVVNVSKQYLPEWGGPTVFNDPRFELVVGDAHQYIFEYDNTRADNLFDVIIMDISDPIEAGPGVMLYTTEYYRRAVECLSKPNGVLVTQSGLAESIPTTTALRTPQQQHSRKSQPQSPASAPASDEPMDPMCFAPIYNTLQTAFDCVVPYSMNIPSFGSDWGYNMAFQFQHKRSGSSATNSSTNNQLVEEWKLPKVVNKGDNGNSINTNVIDELIETHISGGCTALKYYDGQTHVRMFNLPKPLRTYMQNDQRVITRDNPIFMY